MQIWRLLMSCAKSLYPDLFVFLPFDTAHPLSLLHISSDWHFRPWVCCIKRVGLQGVVERNKSNGVKLSIQLRKKNMKVSLQLSGPLRLQPVGISSLFSSCSVQYLSSQLMLIKNDSVQRENVTQQDLTFTAAVLDTWTFVCNHGENV